jgi:hypothetical protein
MFFHVRKIAAKINIFKNILEVFQVDFQAFKPRYAYQFEVF